MPKGRRLFLWIPIVGSSLTDGIQRRPSLPAQVGGLAWTGVPLREGFKGHKQHLELHSEREQRCTMGHPAEACKRISRVVPCTMHCSSPDKK